MPFLSLLSPQPALINCRYRLLEPLGAGGMGVVYRAYDRLTGQVVALKQLTIAPQDLEFSSRPPLANAQQLLLSLAQEFKFLASLRHPHIVSVYDYGFDNERQPYFTMELLEGAQTLINAGCNQPLNVQVDLLVQTLQALAYLHRRGLLHHDLKPENVLVSQERVRVLDFGLSVLQDQARRTDSRGTLLYLAPEVMLGGVYSPASDLYAVGLMAYKMLTGCHPFYNNDLESFIDQLVWATPDLYPLPTAIAPIIARLLDKDPGQRYPNAEQVIAALCTAIGYPASVESAAIRESFLQAATFVGREDELLTLTVALGAAQRGQGSAWLIGGESGVGKSRLLDELHIQALVAGAMVLRGQAVEGGGLPYQLWHEPLRRLSIASTLSDLEAGVLKEVVPDLEKLLERRLLDMPKLAGTASQERLGYTIVELFKRLPGPVVLLLEDLHWSSGDLAVLQQLNRLVAEQSWLIVAAYRDDERPQLVTELPGINLIKLARLTEAEIILLSTAMLGDAGQQPALVELLRRQTEGNTFFMVEVIRALAEEAGQLSAIGRMTLPARVIAGGMQALLQRRLRRLPTWAQPLLHLAALAGRQLDQAVLQVLAPTVDLSRWLQAGADAAILEVQDEQWRFTHDKLREELVGQGSEAERQHAYQQIAQAIEQVYPHDRKRVESLLVYWQAANVPDKELFYLLQVVRQRSDLGLDPQETQTLLLRGLTLSRALPQTDKQQITLLTRLGDIQFRQGDYASAYRHFINGLSLAETLADQGGQAQSLYGLGRLAWREGDLPRAEQLLQRALLLAQSSTDQEQINSILMMLGVLCSEQADYATAQMYYQQSRALAEQQRDELNTTLALINLGNDAQIQGDYAVARAYVTDALNRAQAINARRYVAHALSILALVAQREGKLELALDYLAQGLMIDRAIDDRYALAYDLVTYAFVQLELGAIPTAQQTLRQGLQVAQELGGQPNILLAFIGFAHLYLKTEQAEQAAVLCGLIQRQPGLTPEIRQQDLAPVLAELATVLTPATLTAAQQHGQSLDVATMIDKLLVQTGENNAYSKP